MHFVCACSMCWCIFCYVHYSFKITYRHMFITFSDSRLTINKLCRSLYIAKQIRNISIFQTIFPSNFRYCDAVLQIFHLLLCFIALFDCNARYSIPFHHLISFVFRTPINIVFMKKLCQVMLMQKFNDGMHDMEEQ